MKNLSYIVGILFLGMLFFTTTPTVDAYTLPSNGVHFGCLWKDASCTTNSIREDVPTPTELSQFYFDVMEACTTAGYNGGVCALQASKAVVAAETYTTCAIESGGDTSGCKAATDYRTNQVTTARPAPADPNAPVSAQPQPSTNLCTQFTDQSQETRCSEILGVCGGASPSECQKTAAIVSIGLSIQEACRGRGISTSECLIQYDAAVAEAEECLSSLAGNSVAQCQNEAQIAAQQAAILAAEAATPPRPPAQTTSTQNPRTPAGNTASTPTGNNNGNIGYTPLEPIPGLEGVSSGNTNFALFLKYVFGVLISLGGLSAVVMLIFGGITYMVSDVVHKKTDALRRVQAAMWGLLLLIASWLILNAINPRLLTFELLINPVSNLSGNTSTNTLTTSANNNVTSLNLSNTDPNRDATLGAFCRTGSINRTPTADGLSTNYTCTPYINNGSVIYP